MESKYFSCNFRGFCPAMVGLVLALTALGLPSGSSADESKPLADQLRRIGSKRIFFGHQSVGDNLLDGLRDLASEANVPLEIAEVEKPGMIDAPKIGHAYLGENTRPLSKIEAFERAMGSDQLASADVVFFKFCYIDFNANTDVQAVFTRYLQMHEKVKEQQPDVSWVHVTVPLTVTQGGVKGYVKGLLGRPAWGEAENMKREAFNELLRAQFVGKEPVFDLAAAESTHEDGKAETFERDGKTYPRLVPGYAYDGEHLNERGRKHVARALVEVLASIP